MEFAPLLHRLAQLARLDLRTLEAAASRSFVIGRGMRERRKRAYFLPNQIERVVASHVETTIEHEIARISEVDVEHVPTLAHVIPDARLLHGCVYARRGRLVLADRGRRSSVPTPSTSSTSAPWPSRTRATVISVTG